MFKAVHAEYTGGGIWFFYGELLAGNYFLVVDDGYVYIVDTPIEEAFEESAHYEWLDDHRVGEWLTEEQEAAFCRKLIEWCLKHVDELPLSADEILGYARDWRCGSPARYGDLAENDPAKGRAGANIKDMMEKLGHRFGDGTDTARAVADFSDETNLLLDEYGNVITFELPKSLKGYVVWA